MTDERRPRLVLVHGTRFDEAQWEGYADLIPRAEVVTVALPGHGVRAGESFTMDAACHILGEAVAAANGRPVAVAGHSLGGYVAATYAQRHPRALAALGLLGAMGDPQAHPVLLRLYTGFPALVDRVGADRMADVANHLMARIGVEAQDLPDSIGYAVVADAWEAVVQECGPHQLDGLDIPVWLITGSIDQLGIDLRAYQRAAKHFRSVVLRRATHIFPLTHRTATAAMLDRMVREIA